jgi:hypothetical protein
MNCVPQRPSPRAPSSTTSGARIELGFAAADHWSETTVALFADAPYHDHAAPLDRVLGYLEFRKALLQGGVPEFTCLVGTMVQETYETTPAIREACERSITGHAATLEADIEAAMRERNMAPDWTAKSLALHTQAVIQGASSSPRPRAEPRSPQTASIICAATSKCCSVSEPSRQDIERMETHNEKDQDHRTDLAGRRDPGPRRTE